jgi:hypothetical protein
MRSAIRGGQTTARIPRGLHSTRPWVCMGLALTACGAIVHPDEGFTPDAGDELRLQDAPAGDAARAVDAPAMDAPQGMGSLGEDADTGLPSDAGYGFGFWLADGPLDDAPGVCSGPQPPVANACPQYGRALVVCLDENGVDVCVSDTLGCPDIPPGERCVNVCASDEYAAWCTLLGDSGSTTLELYLTNGCRVPQGSALAVSSSAYLCCKCPD